MSEQKPRSGQESRPASTAAQREQPGKKTPSTKKRRSAWSEFWHEYWGGKPINPRSRGLLDW